MALVYNFKKYKDVYTIENNGLVTLTYTLRKVECDSTTIVRQGEILVGQTVILPIKHIDGVYRITISDSVLEETLPDILFYNNLLLTIIDSTEEVLCGCKGCNTCEDCNNCEQYLLTLTTILAYSIVNNPTYSPYINSIAEQLKCDIDAKVLCLLTNIQILGETEVEDLLKEIVALYYLAFYLYDLSQATDAEEAEYIKIKYLSSKIMKCIRKLGINIDEQTEIITEDMQVFYWQLNNPLDTITEVIPLFNSTFLNDKPVLPFESFEDGETVTYSQIGRICFAIKETDLLNFSIFDSLNNDVTDEFDNHYFVTTRTVLFVSKLPYSFSNMYFKFKKNLFNE